MTSRPTINGIRLADGREIRLESNSILAVVGPNNAGKTHFLRTVVAQLHGATVRGTRTDGGLIASISLDWGTKNGDFEELTRRARTLFKYEGEGRFHVHNDVQYPGGLAFHVDDIPNIVYRDNSIGIVADLFVQFDDAVERIAETELQQLESPDGYTRQPLVQRARESPEATKLIQFYFQKVFGKEISYYDRGDGKIGFLLAPEASDASRAGGALTDNTISHMENSPKLWFQGLGMRSVLGLLLRIFAQEKSILVIDEPEAFLHPPQSSMLGGVLSEIATKQNRQLVLSTHDRHILQGLTKDGGNRIHIERLDGVNEERRSASIEPAKLSVARATSLIRFSPLLDALFSKITIVVENETDALFYSELLEEAINSKMPGSGGFRQEDFLFLGVGGKTALGRTAGLVRSLQAHVIAIADFDVIDNWNVLEKIVTGVGRIDVSRAEESYRRFEEAFNEHCSTNGIESDVFWKELKSSGLTIESADEVRTRASELLDVLDEGGIIICHVGEVEDLDKQLKQEVGKAEWVRRALGKHVHSRGESLKISERIFCSLSFAQN